MLSIGKLLAEVRRRRLSVVAPSREVDHKAPGMLFKGTPKNDLTKVQIVVE